MTSDDDNLIPFPFSKRSDPVHPRELDQEEAKIFAETIGDLASSGPIEPECVERAARLSKRIIQTKRLSRTIAADGETLTIAGELKPHPAIAMREASMLETQQLLGELGLSPSSR